MCRMSWKSGSLNLLEPSGSHRTCYGTLYLYFYEIHNVSGSFSAHHQELSTAHSALHMLYRFDDSLRVGSGWDCSVECAVNNFWGWALKLPETFRFRTRINLEISASVGFCCKEICHDARSYERKSWYCYCIPSINARLKDRVQLTDTIQPKYLHSYIWRTDADRLCASRSLISTLFICGLPVFISAIKEIRFFYSIRLSTLLILDSVVENVFMWAQTQDKFCTLYAFFWVISWRLEFICRRFGILCLFHLHRQVEVSRMN